MVYKTLHYAKNNRVRLELRFLGELKMTLRLIKSIQDIDNLNDYISIDGIIKLSGLTQGQINTLNRNNLLSEGIKSFHNMRERQYPIYELIYCRIIYELRKCYPMPFIRKFFEASHNYKQQLITNNYILMENDYHFIEFIDDIEDDDILDELKSRFIYSCNVKIVDKIQGYIEVNRTYINLKDIRIDLYNMSFDYGLQSKLEKIA